MKKGIALLELIFSIVIIAIALMSVPNLMQSTSKASNKVIMQESISNAASYANMIMSAFWDENCTNPKYENPILYVQKQDSSLQEYRKNDILMGRRVGSSMSTSRRFRNDITGKRLTASTILAKEDDDGEPDDIDDYNNRSVMLVKRVDTSIQEGDYKDVSIKLDTTVNYISDNADDGYDKQTVTFNNPFDPNKIENLQSTNIKMITLRLISQSDPNKKIVLKAFSCNIGSSQLQERLFN